jgi:hypothetical protein
MSFSQIVSLAPGALSISCDRWPCASCGRSPVGTEPSFPVDVIQVPFGHDHERVEAFLLLALDKPLNVRLQVG